MRFLRDRNLTDNSPVVNNSDEVFNLPQSNNSKMAVIGRKNHTTDKVVLYYQGVSKFVLRGCDQLMTQNGEKVPMTDEDRKKIEDA